jgi:site-specific recombinase XerD
MKVTYYANRNCYRIVVPSDLSPTGKNQQLYFQTKQEAQAKIRELQCPRNQIFAQTPEEWIGVLGYAQRELATADIAREAIQHYIHTVLSINKKATILKAAELYIENCQHEKLNCRTIADRRRHLKELCDAMLEIKCVDCTHLTAQKLKDYFGAMDPGTTRKTKRKNISPFIAWLKNEGYLATNLMDNVPDKDKSWGINDEYLPVETFRRILSVCAGLEPMVESDDSKALEEDRKPTEKFKRLLPFFVLGGLAGIRRCEMISSYQFDPTINWSDILWKKDLIHIRDEVAKQTNAKSDERMIPLEPSAKEWLQMVAKSSGPVIDISQSTLQRLIHELLLRLRIKVPENALRNSYATYALAIRSLGEVAKALGDLESTAKRHYVGDLVDKEDGRAWFAIAPSGRKIIPISQAA